MGNLISVIIPVYNVEPYLPKCIDSVLAQTHTNFEVILVDDGSTDRSPEICDEYAEKDRRVNVIHQVNKGLSMARNAGLDRASGAWVYFLDSDDWIDSTLLENTLKVVISESADICSFNSRDVLPTGEIAKQKEDTQSQFLLQGENIIKSLIDESINIRFEVWNKLWSRKLIGDIRFIEGQVSEDVYFDRVLFSRCSKMVHIDKTMHNYLIQRRGNTNSSFKLQRFCVFDEYKQWVLDLKENKELLSAEVIAFIACNTAAGLYYSAKTTHQSNEVLYNLKAQFLSFAPTIERTEHSTKKLKLFKNSPLIYCLVSYVWKRILKR